MDLSLTIMSTKGLQRTTLVNFGVAGTELEPQDSTEYSASESRALSSAVLVLSFSINSLSRAFVFLSAHFLSDVRCRTLL